MTHGKHKDGKGSAGTVVLGTELAQASEAQRRHEEAQGAQTSPLAGLRYSSNEARSWRWADSPTDGRIKPVVTHFAVLDEAGRDLVRNSLSMDDFYTLFTFADRCALAVLRGSDATAIEAAFVSLAMIDLNRVDWRDLLMAHYLLCYAGERIGAPVADLVRRTIELAEPGCAAALREQRTERINLAKSCGYREVLTAEGVALFQTDYHRFSPKADLEKIAFETAVALETKGYEIETINLASNLPLTWLASSEDSAIAKMVRGLSGCISIRGTPLADPAPESSGQSLLVFLGEAASEADASEIAAGAEHASSADRTELGVASRRLCAVVIQWSWIMDMPPMEDKRSLERLRSVFELLLD
jgi:hypothetical protein